MNLRRIPNDSLIDWEKLDNLPADVNAELDLKVDKITWKGLSTEDYTTTEKNKLAWIEIGAEVNNISDINAIELTDWLDTTLHTHDYINLINKPSIPTKTSDITNDSLINDIIAGTNITIDKTDPFNPIINSTWTSGLWDMLKADYDPAWWNSQVAFASELSSYQQTWAKWQPLWYAELDWIWIVPNSQLPAYQPAWSYEPANANIQTHISDVTTNPHNVTKTQVGLGNVDNTSDINKPISNATSIALWLKQTGFTWVDETTPVNVTVNYTTRVLTVTAVSWSSFNVFTDWNGIVTKHTISSPCSFPAFTNTWWFWYFYFDTTWTAITTQTQWTNFDIQTRIYRIYWSSALEYSIWETLDTYPNTISTADHIWKSTQWTQYVNGFTNVSNLLTSWAPNANWRNSVVALTSGTNLNDNLAYTVTNWTWWWTFTQDLWNVTPASLDRTNSALFRIGRVSTTWFIEILPATRFPFPWDTGTNRPEYISSLWVRTLVSSTNFFSMFVYTLNDQRNWETMKIISAPNQYTNITNARASSWNQLQTLYPITTDSEIRPMYRLIFEYRSSYDVWCKYSVLREVLDLRKTAVTTVAVASWSLPATSITETTDWNVQTALDLLRTSKQATLVSGTNIKTVNGATLLWSGDLVITTWVSYNWINGQSFSFPWEIIPWKIAELTSFASWTFAEMQVSTLTRTTWTTTVTVKKNWTAIGTATVTSATTVTNWRYYGVSTDLADTFVANDVITIEVADTWSPYGTWLLINLK